MPRISGPRAQWQGPFRKDGGSGYEGSDPIWPRPVKSTDKPTLFVGDHAAPGATVYTDEAIAYRGLPFKHPNIGQSLGWRASDDTND